MTNYIYLVARAKEPFRLSDSIQDFKKFTANQFLPLLQLPQKSRNEWMMKWFEFAVREHQRNCHCRLWAYENHVIALFTPVFTQQKPNYIHNNPVRTGIVEKQEDYLIAVPEIMQV